MTELIGSMLVAAVICLLVLVAGYRFMAIRKQLASGRSIGRFLPRKQNNEFVFETTLSISIKKKWCRLLLTLKTAESNVMQHSPKFFSEKVAFLSGTSYTLTMKDHHDRIIHTETGSLGPFATWLESRHFGTATLLHERSSGSRQGTVTLLEFLPGEAAQYTLSLHIVSSADEEQPGSSSTWEVLAAELEAREDVLPLSQTVNYPHNRVRI